MVLEVFQTMLADLYTNFINLLPGIIFALITLAIGYVMGRVVGAVFEKVSAKAGVDAFTKKKGVFAVKLSSVIGVVTRWTIYLVFIIQAVNLLEISAVTEIVSKVITVIPEVIGAAVIFIASYAIALYVQQVIGSRDIYSDLLGKISFFLIAYVGIALALSIVRLPTGLVDQVLLVIIASLGGGVAIAIGWGLKDTVAELAADYRKKFKKR